MIRYFKQEASLLLSLLSYIKMATESKKSVDEIHSKPWPQCQTRSDQS